MAYWKAIERASKEVGISEAAALTLSSKEERRAMTEEQFDALCKLIKTIADENGQQRMPFGDYSIARQWAYDLLVRRSRDDL